MYNLKDIIGQMQHFELERISFGVRCPGLESCLTWCVWPSSFFFLFFFNNFPASPFVKWQVMDYNSILQRLMGLCESAWHVVGA